MIIEKYIQWEAGRTLSHAKGAFPTNSLQRIEEILPSDMEATAESGCGKSTILFSNLAKCHFVFSIDDRALLDQSSVLFYHNCPVTNKESVTEIFGPTQDTLATYSHRSYDAVLLDGPHGWPFPEYEYMRFYPYIKPSGYLIVDDVRIPTIGRMADILAEDEMWEFVEIVGNNTAIFRRTNAPMFNPKGDGWWTQKYNRARVPSV